MGVESDKKGGSDQELAAESFDGGPLRCALASTSADVGGFKVAWSQQAGRLTMAHANRPDQILWSNVPQKSFLTVGVGDAQVKDARGFFKVKDKVSCLAREQILEAFDHDVESGSLSLRGTFADVTAGSFEVEITAKDEQQLSLKASARVAQRRCNRLCFVLLSRPEEEFFGFGAQFTHLHMKGRRVPVLSQEPGIGRGIQPLTTVMEKCFGAGGTWWNTYAPTPMCLSTDLRGLCLENTEYSVFDLRPAASLRLGAFTETLATRVFCGSCPVSLLEAYTRFCGRMRPLPSWVQRGAVLGIQGGTTAVRKALAEFEEHNVPISAIWLQDWVGRRKTGAGSQLWWHWEVNREHYPGWEALVNDLREKGIRVLTYINPFIVDASRARRVTRDLHAEACKERFFVMRGDGSPYPIQNTTFSASMIDLSNPGCREWIKSIIKENLINVGASGWMLDYAEALPFDADLHGSENADSFHNSYPIEWAKVNREAIDEAGVGDDALFFTRSGYHRSPSYSTCFWLGDQLTSWREEDGIKSVVVGLLSSGLSGMSLNHADIGGYTSTAVLPFHVPFITFSRSQELLMRWAELSAFTAIFRSHEGNVPRRNHQVVDHPNTLAHFGRFARVYAALAGYRDQLCVEAASSGLPLVRHPWLHYPADAEASKLKFQFLLGSDFMVAPVLDKGTNKVTLYLPMGAWVHLWSGQEVVVEGPCGLWQQCYAPMGFPPVFYLSTSIVGREVAKALTESKDMGPAWDVQACTAAADPKKKHTLAAGDQDVRMEQSAGRWGGFCMCSRRNRRRSRQVATDE